MADQKHSIQMASADPEDIKRLYLLYNVLENLGKYHATSLDDFEHFEDDEKKYLRRIFDQDGDLELDGLIEYLYGLTHGFHRVVMGFEVLFENCADPTLSYLDYNKDIKDMTLVWNHLEEHLKAGGEVCITPDSTIGQMILISAQKEEGKEVSNG